MPFYSHRTEADAAWMFFAVILSALALASIIVTEAFRAYGVPVSFQHYQVLLAATACVAFPLAGLAAQYDANARTLEEVVPTDPLTGLVSPRFLELSVSREVDQMTSASAPGAVALFEIDHLPQLRETFGEAYGDQVVYWVAETAVARLRAPHDRLARIADGRFIAVFKSTSLNDAEGICERLLRELKEAAAQVDINGNKLSLSFGVAPILPGMRFTDSREEAAIALNDAIRFGRNQVRSRHCVVKFGD